MAGPVVYYKDYMDFITGKNFSKYLTPSENHIDNKDKKNVVSLEPSPKSVVLKKVVSSVLCALIFVSFISSFPIHRIKEASFVETKTVFNQMCYLSIVTLLVRFKYYHAWLMADAICNLSGLGFDGYASDGSAKWDLVSNVDVLKFEFGSSLRESIDNWNKGTNIWLRYVVYDRQESYRTVFTYGLSSLWHGFYPGYYLTFASAALFTFASRAVRHSIVRSYFQESPSMKGLYDFLSMVTTRVIVTYITFSFIILEFWPSIRIFGNMYFCFHLLALWAILLLPTFHPLSHHQHSPVKNQLSRVASNGVSGVQG